MTLQELPLVLHLDTGGNPLRWITYEDSAYYYAKGLVAWSLGQTAITLRGGTNAKTGKQSILTMDTIVAVKGKLNPKQYAANMVVQLTNKTLFRRDQQICAYCGDHFATSDLTRDHILPSSRGGPNTWMNCVTACSRCNKKKDDHTPEEVGMQLLYVPYIPNRAEHLILQNRKILTDQMEFLKKLLPPHSRVLNQ
jgi:hypothetical protein